MSRILIRFEIDGAVRREFKALCARSGTTMSATLRKFIWAALAAENTMPYNTLDSAKTKEVAK